MRDTKFKPGQSGNPRGRTPGSGTIGKLRADIAVHIPDIVAKMVEKAKEGDSTAARLLLERAIPALRPTDHPETLALPGATLTEQGNSVIAAIASGQLAPVQGGALLAALVSLAKLTEADELEKRIVPSDGSISGACMSGLDRRIAVLEQQAGQAPSESLRLIFLVCPGEELHGVQASEYWPAMDRVSDESEREFMERCLAAADAAMPAGHIALVGARSD